MKRTITHYFCGLCATGSHERCPGEPCVCALAVHHVTGTLANLFATFLRPDITDPDARRPVVRAVLERDAR